jgi:hypothetical protein
VAISPIAGTMLTEAMPKLIVLRQHHLARLGWATEQD